MTAPLGEPTLLGTDQLILGSHQFRLEFEGKVYADLPQTGNTIQLLPADTGYAFQNSTETNTLVVGRHMLHSFTGAEFGIYCDVHESMADEFIKLLDNNLEGAQFAQVEAATSLALIEQACDM